MKGILKAVMELLVPGSGRAPESAGKSGQPAPAETGRPTILVIEDNVVEVEALRLGLSGGGFKVMTANSGVKGLDMLRFIGKDLRVVVLDFSMPRLDGLETLRHLRKQNPHAKVIGLTGVDFSALPEGFGSGVDVLIAKPCSPAKLIATVKQLLGQ
jgi:CheY-like chemotaxis protein